MRVKNNLIKSITITLFAITVFTVTLVAGSKLLQSRFGISKELLESAKQVMLDIKQGQNEKMSATNSLKPSDSVMRLLIERGEGGKFQNFVIEVFHCKTNKLLFLTVPGSVKVTMQDEMYLQLQAENPTIPQMLSIEALGSYLKEEQSAKIIARLLESLMEIKFDSVSIVPSSWFKQWFSVKQDGEESVSVLSDNAKNKLAEPVTKRGMKGLFESLYQDDTCYFSVELSKLLPYLEAYESLGEADITAQLIPGEHTNSAYLISVIETRQLIYSYQTEKKEG